MQKTAQSNTVKAKLVSSVLTIKEGGLKKKIPNHPNCKGKVKFGNISSKAKCKGKGKANLLLLNQRLMRIHSASPSVEDRTLMLLEARNRVTKGASRKMAITLATGLHFGPTTSHIKA